MPFRRSFLGFLIVTLLLLGLTSCQDTNPVVAIETELGTIQIELYQKKAPITVANFLRYVESNKLNEGEFYRVVKMDNQPNNDVKIEVIQGGLGWSDDIIRYDSIPIETTEMTGIKHLNGTISMARSTPGSASSEFFICIGEQPELDFKGLRNPDGFGFAAFGQVISGMDVVLQIQKSPSQNQLLTPTIKINRASIETNHTP